MQAQPSVALPTGDYSARVGSVGWLAVIGNPVAVLGLLMVDYQSGGHGEMGSFYRGNIIWFVAFGLWGFGTGLGLLRAWRWARVSALIFCGLLAAGGIFGIVAFLTMPTGNISGTMLFLARVSPTLSSLIPIAIAYRLMAFFNRKEVKAYFARTGTAG